MKDIALELTFYQCRGIAGKDRLKPLAERVFAAGFEFEQHVDGRMRKIQRPEQIAGLIDGHYQVLNTDQRTNVPTRWRLAFPARPQNMADLIGFLEFYQFDAHTNRLVISALFDFEFADQRGYVEPYAHMLTQMARDLYAWAQPELGWIDKESRNATNERDIRKRRLKAISWVNVFGPEYVQQYGRDFLLGLPGHTTELLPDGGVFHQLSTNFTAVSPKEASAIRRKVVEYCAARDLKVRCYAPYAIPRGVVSATSRIVTSTTDEVQAYLELMLGTTLTLDDGTRVKPISVPWTDFTDSQRQMAIQTIWRIVEEELKHVRSGGRVRFEFNEIPDELHQMLLSIVENECTTFEWVSVQEYV